MNDPGARKPGGATSAAILTWFASVPALVGSASLTGDGVAGQGGLTTGAAAFVALLATGAGVTVLMAGRRLSRASGGNSPT